MADGVIALGSVCWLRVNDIDLEDILVEVKTVHYDPSGPTRYDVVEVDLQDMAWTCTPDELELWTPPPAGRQELEAWLDG